MPRMTPDTFPSTAASGLPEGSVPAQVAIAQIFRPVLPALLLGLILLGLLFHAEAMAAVNVWIDSTAYSHCFFVIPIAIYLGFERRRLLAGVPIRPVPWAVLAAIPLGGAWLVAERLGIMEGRQIIAMSLLELMALAVLGWRMFRVLAAPLLYLFFLIPFGAFLTPALQSFTAEFIDAGLQLLGIPHQTDAYFITIPEGRFVVAEACAGLRFLIASIAFGVLYACLMYRSVWRRLGFVAASLVVPIIANGIRALGIVVIGHLLGSAQAAVTDHILYGWLFFSIVIVLLILAGLPFRQDQQRIQTVPQAAAAPAVPMGGPLVAAVALGVLAAGGPAASAAFDRNAQVALAVPAAHFAVPTGCQLLPADAPGPGIATDQFACPAGHLIVTTRLFPPRDNPGHVLTIQRTANGEADGDDPEISNLNIPGIAPPDWHFVVTSAPARVTASLLWIDGGPAQGGLAGRVALARDSLFGTTHGPVLVTLRMFATQPQLTPAQLQNAQNTMAGFLQAQTNLPATLTALSTSAAAMASPR